MYEVLFRKPFNEEYDFVGVWDGEFSEISVFLEEKSTGIAHQDITIVRPKDEKVEVLIYADCYNEDYTNTFDIDVFKPVEEEEEEK